MHGSVAHVIPGLLTMRAVDVHVDEFRVIHRGMAMVVSAVNGVCDRRGHGRTHCSKCS
jgi:hypothetical protein